MITHVTAHPDQLPGPLATAACDPLAFTDLIQQLRRRALARVDPGALQLHRLLAAILRTRVPRESDMPTLAVRLLRAAVPPDPWDNPPSWTAWLQLLPHVLAATDTDRSPEPADDDLTWLLDRAGTYLQTRENPAPRAHYSSEPWHCAAHS